MARLGGPVFIKTNDPVELARAHHAAGYGAAYCPPVSLDDLPHLKAVRAAFEKENVVLAEVGSWCNLIAIEPEKRKKNVERTTLELAKADEVGALCCVDYLGSLEPNSEFAPHPENLSDATFELAVETIRKIIDGAKPKRAKFCMEMMEWLFPDSASECLHLIKAVDRPAFAAHLDPVNIIVSPRQYFNTTKIVRECFELLGPWIVSCHAKDIKLGPNLSIHLDEIRPGLGALDYRTYWTELNRLPQDVPLMLEHLPNEAEYVLAAQHLRKVADSVGVKLN